MVGFWNDQSETIKVDQSIVNKILQQAQNKCVFSCKNVNSSDINIINTTVDGDVEISQTCDIIGCSCLMKTLLDNTLINTISDNLSQAESLSDGLLSLSLGSSNSADVDVNTAVKNLASQIVSSNCKTSEENDSYETINVVGSKINGDFKIDQNSSISQSTCIINNLLKNFDSTSDKLAVKQSIAGSDLLKMLIIIVVIIIVVGGIGYYLYNRNPTTPQTGQKQRNIPQPEIVINEAPTNIKETKF
jgi:hypothetical protein